MWRLPKDACLAGKTVLRMPRDSTALQPCAAPTLGESSADSSEEVASKDFQDCLGDDGSARSGWVFQVETKKVQRHGAAVFPGVLRAVRTARLHLMSTGVGWEGVIQKSTRRRSFTAQWAVGATWESSFR